MYMLYRFRDIISYFPKFTDATPRDPEHISTRHIFADGLSS